MSLNNIIDKGEPNPSWTKLRSHSHFIDNDLDVTGTSSFADAQMTNLSLQGNLNMIGSNSIINLQTPGSHIDIGGGNIYTRDKGVIFTNEGNVDPVNAPVVSTLSSYRTFSLGPAPYTNVQGNHRIAIDVTAIDKAIVFGIRGINAVDDLPASVVSSGGAMSHQYGGNQLLALQRVITPGTYYAIIPGSPTTVAIKVSRVVDDITISFHPGNSILSTLQNNEIVINTDEDAGCSIRVR